MKTIKMKRADAEKWLAALRSGEYKQGRDYLCRSHNQNTFAGMAQVEHNELCPVENVPGVEFCCLGVLQHVLDGGVTVDKSFNVAVVAGTPTAHWLSSHGITFHTAYVLGAPGRVPEVECADGTYRGVAELNDGGYTFAQLADLIEEHIEYTDGLAEYAAAGG